MAARTRSIRAVLLRPDTGASDVGRVSLWLLVLVVLAVVVFASGFVIGWRIGRAVIFVALIFAVIAVAYATRLAGRRGTRG